MIVAYAKKVREDKGARRWDGRLFGEQGSSWATIVDITLCDIGVRRAPQSATVPTKIQLCARVLVAPTIDLNVQLLIRSPSFVEIPAHFISPTDGERSLVQDSWGPAAVAAWVASKVNAIGPESGEVLIAALRRSFWVDDPDDDQWSDVPIEDG